MQNTAALNTHAKAKSPIYSVAVIDDCLDDFFMIKYLLKNSNLPLRYIEHYPSVDGFLQESAESPDVVLLDRCMPDSVLSEARIREIRARHNNCGVILHTGRLTPSLRSTAAHEGAVAVVEKGSLNAAAIGAVVAAAAQMGPSIRLQ